MLEAETLRRFWLRVMLQRRWLMHKIFVLESENRPKFEDITVVYGARSPGMLLYSDELAQWEQRDDINMHITVDATNDPGWKYNVGFVPAITEKKITTAENAIAIVCGPPIMIKFTQPVLEKLGFPPERIIHVYTIY